MLQAPLPYLYGCTQQVGDIEQPPDTGCGGCGRHCLQASTPQGAAHHGVYQPWQATGGVLRYM